MRRCLRLPLLSLALLSTFAFGQTPAVLRDLDDQARVPIPKDDLVGLMTNAKMSRAAKSGNTHIWTNDPDGTFIVSSDNRDRGSRASTAHGKWHISDDGRYCVLIEWKSVPTEEWCRYILKTGDAYYSTVSVNVGTEKLYKLDISK